MMKLLDVIRTHRLVGGLAILLLATPATAAVIHVGSTDPALEGWTPSPVSPLVTAGPVSPDPDFPGLGIDAWSVNDSSSEAGSAVFYDAGIVPAANEVFSLRARLRVVNPDDAIDFGVFLEVTDLGGRRYTVSFGASNGATQIYLSSNGSTTGPATHTVPTSSPGQTEYIWVELARSRDTLATRLLVNDVEVVGNYTGFETLSIPARVLFGAGSSAAQGHGRYASVTFDTDSDGDGLLDLVEAVLGTNPADPDTDADGLDDFAEIERGTDPLNEDSDEDGLLDGVELGSVWAWATGNTVSGGFGGIPAADSICAADGALKGITHAVSARAWLSTSTLDARDHIADVGPYLRWDDAALVATDLADLTDGILTNPISTVIQTLVWSGTFPTGVSIGPNCSDWTSEIGSGGIGSASITDPAWTNLVPPGQEPFCNSFHALICFAKTTDALLADTDADSFDDGEEIAAGTDPTDPLSFPQPVSALGLAGRLLLAALLAGPLAGALASSRTRRAR